MDKIDNLLAAYIINPENEAHTLEGLDSKGRVYTWKNFKANLEGFFTRLMIVIMSREHTFYTNKKICNEVNRLIHGSLQEIVRSNGPPPSSNSPPKDGDNLIKISAILHRINLNKEIDKIDGKRHTLQMFNKVTSGAASGLRWQYFQKKD